MPLYKDGNLFAMEEYGETEKTTNAELGDEMLTVRTIHHRDGHDLVYQSQRRNPGFDSDFLRTEVSFTHNDIPRRTLEVAYWLSESLSISVSYREYVNGDTGNLMPTSDIQYFPDDVNTDVDTCGIEYDANGHSTVVYLVVHEKKAETENYDTRVMGVQAIDSERFNIYENVGDNRVQRGVGAFGIPFEVQAGMSWEIMREGTKMLVKIEETGEKNHVGEYEFPQRIDLERLEEILTQEKPIGGVYRKVSTQKNITEE